MAGGLLREASNKVVGATGDRTQPAPKDLGHTPPVARVHGVENEKACPNECELPRPLRSSRQIVAGRGG